MKSKIGYALLMSLYCVSALADGGNELTDQSSLRDLAKSIKEQKHRVTFERPVNARQEAKNRYFTRYELSFEKSPLVECTLEIRVQTHSDNPDQLELPAGFYVSGGSSSEFAAGDGYGIARVLLASGLPPSITSRIEDVKFNCLNLANVGEVRDLLKGIARIESEESLAQAARNALAAQEQFNQNVAKQLEGVQRQLQAQADRTLAQADAVRQASQANRKPAVLETEIPTAESIPLNQVGKPKQAARAF